MVNEIDILFKVNHCLKWEGEKEDIPLSKLEVESLSFEARGRVVTNRAHKKLN